MTEEVVKTRTIKGWDCDFIIQVIKDSNWIRLKESHTGSVPDTHCAVVWISPSKMDFYWEDRRGKTKSKVGFASHIDLFKAAEDQFIKLLSQHLKHEYNGEKLGQRDWRIIHRGLHVGLRQLVPEKEMEERLARRNRESVLRGLKRARNSAEINRYPHIASELTRLIEEVEG